MNDKGNPDESQIPEEQHGYVLPGGERLSPDQYEARLKAEAASAKEPKESEDANYKLAGFYLGEASPLLAYPILKAIRETTGDGDRKEECEKWLVDPRQEEEAANRAGKGRSRGHVDPIGDALRVSRQFRDGGE